MPTNNSKNILFPDVNFMNIALLPSKTRVLIIGAGRAGFIKARSFVKSGCMVSIISRSFSEDFEILKDSKNIKFINQDYNLDFILDKHIIVIAVGDEYLLQTIITDCEVHNKLYLNCTNFKKGIFIVPTSGMTKRINFSINSIGGNPKTSMFLVKVMEEKLKEYDELVKFNDALREKVRTSPHKIEIMDFAASEDFNFFIKKGNATNILNLFYGGDNFEIKNCD